MHKITKIVLILINLTIHGNFIIAQQPPCLNYYNQTGTCVPITSCQSLLNLESNPLRTFDDLLILDGSYCGPETGLKWVCCVSGIIPTEKPLEISTAKTPAVRSTTQKNVTPFKIVTPVPSKSKRAINNLVERNRLLPDPDNDECGLHFPDRVVGGNQTALDEHPWTALLGYVLWDNSTIFGCGGSLINDMYVLTAAHCIPQGDYLSFVRLGEWNVNTTYDCIQNQCIGAPLDLPIEEVIIHPGYNNQNHHRYDDIALLRLSQRVTFSPTIRPICLPLAQQLRPRSDHHLQRYTVVGWGFTNDKIASDIKLKAELPGVQLAKCNNIYQQIRQPIRIRETQLCAGGEAGIGSCGGDSGGPLLGVFSPRRGVNYNYLAGIISFGIGNCGKKNWPGIFTNVASYLDWIQDNVKQ